MVLLLLLLSSWLQQLAAPFLPRPPCWQELPSALVHARQPTAALPVPLSLSLSLGVALLPSIVCRALLLY
jgi:hypothetical protein